jgi:hypothetical protein
MIKVYRKKQTTTVHLTQDVLNKYNDLCITGIFFLKALIYSRSSGESCILFDLHNQVGKLYPK